ncbi:toll/interleukin-1 receptor domain-containing protein [Helicobacter cetorum]|uniref:toll/interleukin-1 receptor domain-containing protein n=1 Tax=Helicobacter cetorum TaxID=138563 RepID=UPI000CF0D8EF
MKKAYTIDIDSNNSIDKDSFFHYSTNSNDDFSVLPTFEFNHATAKKIRDILKDSSKKQKDIILSHKELQKAFFSPFMPQLKKTQVFLSHSHADKNKALAIKDYLEEKLRTECVFIDSLFWDYKDDILNEIAEYDDISEIEDAFTLILRESLEIMIQKCPYFVFLQSKNSISYQGLSSITYSAWIYEELKIANAFLQKPRITAMRVSHNTTELLGRFKPISLDNLCELLENKF